MIKFFVLTSGDLEALDRTTARIPIEDLVVVINTLDDEYRELAKAFCIHRGFTAAISESDGTPSTGKNSVLDLFLQGDDQYMVHIDGDDIITDHGIDLYKRIAHSGNAPDVISLYRQLGCRYWEEGHDLSKGIPGKFDWGMPFRRDGAPEDYDVHVRYLTNFFMKANEVDEDKARGWAQHRVAIHDMMKLYSEDNEFLCRITFLSRKAASLMHYDPALMIGEDVTQWIQLKKLWSEGKINMVRRKEVPHPTYIYMMDHKGVSSNYRKEGWKQTAYDWQVPFVDALKRVTVGVPPNTPLPDLNDSDYD